MRLGRIHLFPIKSLDGLAVERAQITPAGILENDRVFAIVDEDGRIVNAKRVPRLHELRCEFDPTLREVRLQPADGAAAQFPLREPEGIARWLSGFLGFAVSLRHDSEKGFPDDKTASGPTITSEASLGAVRDWYPELTLEGVRRRFRANLELTDGPPFCEDAFFGPPGSRQPFAIGHVTLLGHNPCQRCPVPSRDPDTGEPLENFRSQFETRRRESLPAWSDPQCFNHFYRFAVNTSIPETEAGKWLHVGDAVSQGQGSTT